MALTSRFQCDFDDAFFFSLKSKLFFFRSTPIKYFNERNPKSSLLWKVESMLNLVECAQWIIALMKFDCWFKKSGFQKKFHIPQRKKNTLWLVISKNEMLFKRPNMVVNSQQPFSESCDQNKMTEYCRAGNGGDKFEFLLPKNVS